MSKQEKPIETVTPFEADMAALAPRASGFDRERLIFLAGQASALRDRSRAARWGWPAGFTAMTMFALCLLVMRMTGPAGNGITNHTEHTEYRAFAAERPTGEEPVADESSVTDAREEPSLFSSWLHRSPPVAVSGDLSFSSYAQMRDQLLRPDGELPRRPAPRVTATLSTTSAERPASYNELLNRLLATESLPAADRLEFNGKEPRW